MNISIVIPNYNGVNLLKKNLPFVFSAAEHYQKETKYKVEIIVPDDASKDESVAFLKSGKHPIILVENKHNKGFSGNVNSGVGVATGDIVILLNSDVQPEKNFIAPLVKHFENERVFAVGCMDKSVEPDGIVLRGRGVGSWQRGFLIHQAGKLDKENTLWVSGGSSAIRHSIWKKLGGLQELYNPFYWEDIDLSYRAQKSGYEVRFEKKSVVIHAHEEGAIKKHYKSDRVKTTAFRNQCTFVWLNITDNSLLLSHVLWLPYHVLSAVKRGDRPFLKGFFQALIRLPQIIAARGKVMRQFTVNDKTILHQFSSEISHDI